MKGGMKWIIAGLVVIGTLIVLTQGLFVVKPDQFAIVTGLVYNYLPFVILAIYSSIQQLNPEMREASADLGAPAWKTLVFVPRSSRYPATCS